MQLTSNIQQSVDKTIDTSHSTLETTEQQSAAIEQINASIQEVALLAEDLTQMSHKE